MDVQAYYKSLGEEMRAVKHRVRLLIRDRHWLSDGEWHESVLRSVLRRHLPDQLAVARGFCVSAKRVSTQLDVLIYDTTAPRLFSDGDFVIVTPDAVRGVIEVKATARAAEISQSFGKLSNIAQLLHADENMPGLLAHRGFFLGYFAYELERDDDEQWLDALERAAQGAPQLALRTACLGPDRLIRFWPQHTEPHLWRTYRLRSQAYGYFVGNVLETLSGRSIQANRTLWFPEEGKGPHRIAERFLNP